MNSATDYTTGLLITALGVADRAVVCDVECEGTRIDFNQAVPVYDVSAMLSDQERSPQCVDMASEGIAYGIARGLLELVDVQPGRTHVRLLRRPGGM